MQEKYRENLQIDSIFNSDEANNLNMKIFYNLNRVLSLLIRNLNSKDRRTKTGLLIIISKPSSSGSINNINNMKLG